MALGSELVREARKRAGLTQEDLAARAGTTQSAIARLEAGRTAPGFERVVSLVAACGMELRVNITEPVIAVGSSRPHVPRSLLVVLSEHGVRTVVTGSLAAALRGGPSTVGTPSVCPDVARSNLECLCRALDVLGARLRTPDGTGTLPFDRTPDELLVNGVWALATSHGELDVVLEPPGTRGYRDLVREATPVLADGLELLTASLPDVVRELEAAKADPDLVHILRRLRHQA
jgi:DNA-binding XRE family transcriptional regulator